MPLFICEHCGAIDNTACGGTFWTKDSDPPVWPVEAAGKALCAECAPIRYRDGRPNPRGGKWHGRFPKRIATQEMIDSMTPEEKAAFVGFGSFQA